MTQGLLGVLEQDHITEEGYCLDETWLRSATEQAQPVHQEAGLRKLKGCRVERGPSAHDGGELSEGSTGGSKDVSDLIAQV